MRARVPARTSTSTKRRVLRRVRIPREGRGTHAHTRTTPQTRSPTHAPTPPNHPAPSPRIRPTGSQVAACGRAAGGVTVFSGGWVVDGFGGGGGTCVVVWWGWEWMVCSVFLTPRPALLVRLPHTLARVVSFYCYWRVCGGGGVCVEVWKRAGGSACVVLLLLLLFCCACELEYNAKRSQNPNHSRPLCSVSPCWARFMRAGRPARRSDQVSCQCAPDGLIAGFHAASVRSLAHQAPTSHCRETDSAAPLAWNPARRHWHQMPSPDPSVDTRPAHRQGGTWRQRLERPPTLAHGSWGPCIMTRCGERACSPA